MLARDYAAEGLGQCHDTSDGAVGRLQHFVVVGVDRDIGVHVTVAGVHVQRDKNAALEHLLVQPVQPLKNLTEQHAVKNSFELGANLLFPGHPHGVVLQQRKHRGGGMGKTGQCRHGAALCLGQRRVEVG